MDIQIQRGKAERLRELHRGPAILVLLNVWDVLSARIIEEAGFPAVATTSAGIANLLGNADGEQVSRDEMLGMVARIARSVRVPVTADLEAGYSRTPEGVAETGRALIAAGGVGLNLEDAFGEGVEFVELSLQVEKIRALREAGDGEGVPLVINARTDAFWMRNADSSRRFAEAVRRGNAFRQAGADCVFFPGVKDSQTIAELVREVPGPVNILAVAGAPPIPELERLGVRRVSAGSGPMRATAGLLRRIATDVAKTGAYSSFTDGAMSYDEANRLVSGKG